MANARTAVKAATGVDATKKKSHNEAQDRQLTARHLRTGSVGRVAYIGPCFNGRNGEKNNDVLYRVVCVSMNDHRGLRRWKIGTKQIQIIENGEVIDTL